MKFIVTGGSGFIGSHVCRVLQENGHAVVNLDVRPGDPAIPWIHADIREVDTLVEAFARHGQDGIFHIAAVANARQSLENPLFTVDLNIRGTAVVLQAARDANVQRVVLASTVWVYNAVAHTNGTGVIRLDENSPILPQGGGHVYTTSKIASEILCHDFRRLYNLDFTILRYGIPYGPGMWPGLALRAFLDNSFQGKPIRIFGDGSAVRRFVYVRELAQAHLLAATSEVARNQIYNLEGERDVTIRELAEAVQKFVPNTQIEYVEEPTRRGELKVEGGTVISNTKAKQHLGWSPTVSLEEGVRATVDWYRREILQQNETEVRA